MLRSVRAVVLIGLIVVASTELLSLAGRVERASITALWLALAVACLFHFARRPAPRYRLPRLDGPLEWMIAGGIVLIAALSLVLAVFTAPNAWDAVTYHLPRISHWISNRSVGHYPTHIDRQLWISPGHEFFALHLELLAGTHRLVNLVQWAAFAGCGWIAAGIAQKLGGKRRARIFAVLFTMSLPMAVAQASGSQVDLFAAFWVALTVYLILDFVDSDKRWTDALLTGSAAGIAVLAKATSVLVLFPFAVWAGILVVRHARMKGLTLVAAAAAMTLIVNAGHLARNQRTFGHPLVNPRGATVLNERFGIGIVVSNILRNATLHSSTRWAWLNEPQQSLVESVHDAIGLNSSDSATTFLGGEYKVARRARSEAFAGAGIHLAAGIFLLLLARRGGMRRRAPHGMMLFAGFVLFCALLKWQPWHGRLHLSWLVLFAPLAAVAAERSRWKRAYIGSAAVLFLAALPMLFRNAARPVLARESIFLMPRERQYFNLLHWIYGPTVKAAELLAANECSRVGFLTTWGDPEETLREAMRNRLPGRIEIHHVGIPPDRYPPGRSIPDTRVCAIVAQYAFPGSPGRPLPVPRGFSLALDEGMVRVYLPDSLVPR